MANGVTVSVMMPTYNAMPYLRDAIESVRGQTFTDWELIVVDDASTDGSAAFLSQLDDPRIHVHRLPHNRGRAHARNVALRHATGRYIAPCDSDDLCLPDRLAREVAYLEAHPDIDVVSGQIEYFWDGEPPQVFLRYPEDPRVIQGRFAKGKMAVPFMASMIRSACFTRFGPFCEEMRYAEDLEWFLRIHRDCTFHTLPDILMRYRHPVRGAAFGKWLATARYGRYAIYHAAMATTASPDTIMPFARFSRRWRNRLGLAVLDTARYVNYRLRAGRGARTLG